MKTALLTMLTPCSQSQQGRINQSRRPDPSGAFWQSSSCTKASWWLSTVELAIFQSPDCFSDFQVGLPSTESVTRKIPCLNVLSSPWVSHMHTAIRNLNTNLKSFVFWGVRNLMHSTPRCEVFYKDPAKGPLPRANP